ncbi:hypothetical protein D3C81_808760 [compost metagenome]
MKKEETVKGQLISMGAGIYKILKTSEPQEGWVNVFIVQLDESLNIIPGTQDWKPLTDLQEQADVLKKYRISVMGLNQVPLREVEAYGPSLGGWVKSFVDSGHFDFRVEEIEINLRERL